jgi:hypothetical protein
MDRARVVDALAENQGARLFARLALAAGLALCVYGLGGMADIGPTFGILAAISLSGILTPKPAQAITLAPMTNPSASSPSQRSRWRLKSTAWGSKWPYRLAEPCILSPAPIARRAPQTKLTTPWLISTAMGTTPRARPSHPTMRARSFMSAQ